MSGYSNMFSNIRREVVIPPSVIDHHNPVTGVIDLKTATSVEFELVAGDLQSSISSGLSLSLEHGDLADYSDMAPVPDGLLIGTEAATDISNPNLVRRIGYKATAGKRYVRVTATPGTNIVSQILPVPVRQIDPQAWTGVSPLVGDVIDTDGYGLVTFIFAIGANSWTGKYQGVLSLEKGSDGVSFSAALGSEIRNAVITIIATAGQNNLVVAYDYVVADDDAERYVRALATPYGVTGGTLGISCVAAKMNNPTATAFGVIALVREVHSYGNGVG